jgi:mannose-1-phosphate guanylyltransferase/mannose-6-phosphate isomerase
MQTPSQKFIPVILSGGMGTRLWPVSRATLPKQFCEFLDESLLEKTIKRLLPLGSVWTLTTKELSVLTNRVFSQAHLPKNQILFEPMGKNTAPAIALLCQHLSQNNELDSIVGIFPADHLVIKEKEFQKALSLAQIAAEKASVVTLGIKPEYAATGFGYIEISSEKKDYLENLSVHPVKSFREKPDLSTAQKFIDSGSFFWNAGIFVFKVSNMIQLFEKLMPEMWSEILKIKKDLSNLTEVYSALKSVSIDYGIMEKLTDQVCVPCDIGWSDLGSWDDVARFGEPPFSLPLANFASVVSHESKNNFVFSDRKKVVGLVDVEDLIVVDTEDALLVSKRGSSQKVRGIVESLVSTQNKSAQEHRFEHRPWGKFTILRDDDYFKSKLISVDPHSQFSYQSHERRHEHWIIVKGAGEVILNDKVIKVKEGQSIEIPMGAKHRMRNTESTVLEFVEVQTGSYFGEDDITRFEDDYSRI